MKLTAFLPCRKGSERVPNKNTRPFGGHAGGLLAIKLGQLLAVEAIDAIVVSSNDPVVLDGAQALGHPKVRIHSRADHLGSSQTSTDALVGHAVELIPEGHILWTHVTSPFFGARDYARCIEQYLDGLARGHDSLMSVTTLQTFLWSEQGPLNYDRSVEKWPRTQTLPPLYEVNSAAFLHSADGYRRLGDRIGAKPGLYATGKVAGFDIDWPEDFELAQAMLERGIATC